MAKKNSLKICITLEISLRWQSKRMFAHNFYKNTGITTNCWIILTKKCSNLPRKIPYIQGQRISYDIQELYKKDLHDPGNHDSVITDLEPDILECEVKWALESITTNKASGGDRIPVELFQILKDDAVKVLHWICQQIWKTQQ